MKNIILIGMMGCGKTTVGRLLAQALGRELVDTDEAAGRAAPSLTFSPRRESPISGTWRPPCVRSWLNGMGWQ